MVTEMMWERNEEENYVNSGENTVFPDEHVLPEEGKSPRKKRIRLTVAYDGTNYCGWQLQPNGITIEEVLNREISHLTGEEIRVIGASRTDSGVHALGNAAVFDTASRIPGEKFAFALNTRLPEDVRIVGSEEVEAGFHPRRVPSVKTYEYRIWNHTFANPTVRLYSKFCYYPLDIEKMNRAAQYLVGEHDFASFCSVGSQALTTVRRIISISVTRDEAEPRMVRIRVSGRGFLYNMVRIISGTLLEIGMGLREPEEMTGILAACDRSKAGPTAEPQGLTLMGISWEAI